MCRACLSVSLNFMVCSDYSARPRFAACVAIMINSQMCTHYFIACSLVKRHFLCLRWCSLLISFLHLNNKHYKYASEWTRTNYKRSHSRTHTYAAVFNNKSSHAIQTTIKVRTLNRTWNVFDAKTVRCFFFVFAFHLLLSFTNFSTKCTFNYITKALETLNSSAIWLPFFLLRKALAEIIILQELWNRRDFLS